jgi:hypothetical protein
VVTTLPGPLHAHGVNRTGNSHIVNETYNGKDAGTIDHLKYHITSDRVRYTNQHIGHLRPLHIGHLRPLIVALFHQTLGTCGRTQEPVSCNFSQQMKTYSGTGVL